MKELLLFYVFQTALLFKVHPFKVYDSMVFSIFAELCKHHNNLILGHFLIPLENFVPASSHSPFLLPPPQIAKKVEGA